MATYHIMINRSSIQQHDDGVSGEIQYSYLYNDTLVECSKCCSQVLHTRLKAEPYMSENGFDYFTAVCPVCGELECCVIVFEKPDPTELSYQSALNRRLLSVPEFTVDVEANAGV